VVVGVSEPDLGPLLCRLLDEEGYDARLAADGIAVIHAITRAVPRLLLLDTRLARLDGLLTLEVVRSVAGGVPALLLADHAGPALRHAAARLGAEVVRKPFENAELLAAVSRQCGVGAGTLAPGCPAPGG
jgi:DNA-binding response OmpR family regulator